MVIEPSPCGLLTIACRSLEMELHEQARTVRTREVFVRFVEALARNFEECPDEWENPTVGQFLEALGRWTEDMDGYYRNVNRPIPREPSWQLLADMLMAARIYA